MLLLCPEWTFGHIIKNSVFTDCSAPRNLQPLCPFRKAYPGAKGDCDDDDDDDDDDNDGHENIGRSFGAEDPDQPIPLFESTRIGESEDSSMRLNISDDTDPPNEASTSNGWKRPSFRQRKPRSRTSSWRENSANATPASSAPSSRRPSRSRSGAGRKRQKATNETESPTISE